MNKRKYNQLIFWINFINIICISLYWDFKIAKIQFSFSEDILIPTFISFSLASLMAKSNTYLYKSKKNIYDPISNTTTIINTPDLIKSYNENLSLLEFSSLGFGLSFIYKNIGKHIFEGTFIWYHIELFFIFYYYYRYEQYFAYLKNHGDYVDKNHLEDYSKIKFPFVKINLILLTSIWIFHFFYNILFH